MQRPEPSVLYELQNEQNDGDEQDDVDQAARNAKGQSTTPENQKDDGNNEEHIQKSVLKTLVVAWLSVSFSVSLPWGFWLATVNPFGKDHKTWLKHRQR